MKTSDDYVNDLRGDPEANEYQNTRSNADTECLPVFRGPSQDQLVADTVQASTSLTISPCTSVSLKFRP